MSYTGRSPLAKNVTFSLLTILSIALLLTGSLLMPPQSAVAQSNSFHMSEYNADITVNIDGSLDVTEYLTYVFDSGSFKRGLREIPLARVGGISGVQVVETTDGNRVAYSRTQFNEDDQREQAVPLTYGSKTEGDTFRIRWVFPETSSGTRSFEVFYHVTGATRVYDDRDELDWYAIPPDWQGDINRSTVRVTFPAGFDPNNAVIASNPPAQMSSQGDTITWTATNIDSGLEVGVQLPKGVLQVTKPSWQEALDREEAFREGLRRNQPLFSFIFLVLAALIFVGGILWLIRRWYRAGRDKPVKLPTDYLTEPPSDLPAGLVGTLLDESADVRDVIATVVDQGAKGNLTIRQVEQGGLFSSKDFEYTQTNSNVQYRFEDMALNALFKKGSPMRLSELKNSFYSDLPPIYEEMYKTLVALKYFPENPKAVRARNIALGFLLMFLGGVVFFLGLTFGDLVSPLLMLPGIALGVVGFVAVLMSGVMPRKTDFGSEEAQKWRAFSRYLQQMQQYTNVQAAADKFQKYLPYAVALGVERQLINQFNSVPAAMPMWYAPYGYYPFPVGVPVGQGRETGGGVLGAPGGDGMGGVPRFDPAGAMQGMSDSFAGSMQGMADSFTDMVNSASNILTSSPSSSGSRGGWGGGGGSFGGGGGGGGGGGAD